MSAAGLVASISGTRMRKKADRALNKELANAPKYKINEEVFENKALAKAQAFGRDRSIQMQQENISQGAANASAEARDITSSTSALLSTVASIQANKNQNLRGLGQDEASFQNNKMQQLRDVNNQVVDEKDKAWNYNVNMPFQMRVARYRDKVKTGSEMEMAGVAAQAQTESALVSSIGSAVGGVAAGCDERLKDNIVLYEPGIDAVMEMRSVEFNYTHDRFNDGRKHLGFIAQEMREIVPHSVDTIRDSGQDGEEDFLKINFNELIPVLVNAIQDQQKKIEALTMALKVAGIVNWIEEPVTK